jgi:hypothetical protein
VKFFAFGAAGLLASAAMLFTTWCVAHRPADYGWRGRLFIALSYLALGIIALIAAWAGVYRRVQKDELTRDRSADGPRLVFGVR